MAQFRPKPIKFVADALYPTSPQQAPEPIYAVGGLPAATTTTPGGITKQPTIATFTGGTDTVTQTNLNTLLTALKAAGIIS